MAKSKRNVSTETEASVHEELFKTLMSTPHRRVDEIVSEHKKQFERDPNFYGHLATYAAYMGNCVVRDTNEVFIATLFVSPYQEHRDAAFAMLQKLPPYQVYRVARIVTGYDEIKSVRSIDEPVVSNSSIGISVERAKYPRSHKNAGKVIPSVSAALTAKDKAMLRSSGKSIPSVCKVEKFKISHKLYNKRTIQGALKSAIKEYLSYREQPENQALMEGAVLRMKKYMRYLYARVNKLPMGDESSWLNQVLFHNKYTEGTRLYSLKKLSESSDPTEQAKLIMENKIPYPVAVSLVKTMTPSVILALVDAMTPQELLANMDSLNKNGANENKDIKALIEQKLKDSKNKKVRMDAMKGAFAAKNIKDIDENLSAIMTDITDAQLKRYGKITLKTAILIDKSGSMENAIEVAKEVSASVAQSCEDVSNLHVYMFDSAPVKIQWSDADGDITKKSSWDKKLSMFRASGGTDPSSVIRSMKLSKTEVDQILVITDEEENTSGKFAEAVSSYKNSMGSTPNVVIIRVGAGREYMTRSCKAIGIDVEVVECKNIDKVALPNIIQLLSGKSMFELIQEILAIPLPTRNSWNNKKVGSKVLSK